jgi:hypothetical protein
MELANFRIRIKKAINLTHYTIGRPYFEEYENKSLSQNWKKYFLNMLDEHFKKNKLS